MAKNFEHATAEELEKLKESVVKAVLHEQDSYQEDQFKSLAKILSAMATVAKKNGVSVSYTVDADGASDICISPYEPMVYSTTSTPLSKLQETEK